MGSGLGFNPNPNADPNPNPDPDPNPKPNPNPNLSNVRRWLRLSMSRFSCASDAGGMGGGAGATAGGGEAWRLQLHGELAALQRSERLAHAS